MAGQIIILPGVSAAASGGAARIDMTAADQIAARMSNLKHVVSARSLTSVAGGGVSGRCRATGLSLVPKGTATALKLFDVAGKRALGLSNIFAAGLGLPAGSQTPSYTAVMTVNIGQADIDSAVISTSPILLGGSNAADVVNLNVLQYFGAGGTPPNVFTARGSDAVNPFASAVRPGGAWVVAVMDFDNTTKTVSLAINQAATFATALKTTEHAPAVDDYVEIGNHSNATSSLRSSKVGDLFLFGDSVLSSALGKSQLEDLVEALKAEYGIAA